MHWTFTVCETVDGRAPLTKGIFGGETDLVAVTLSEEKEPAGHNVAVGPERVIPVGGVYATCTEAACIADNDDRASCR